MKIIHLLSGLIAMCAIAAQAKAETRWKVINAESELSFQVKIGGSLAKGRFDDWSADIIYDPERPASATVAVEITLSSAMINVPQAQSLIKTAEWLDVTVHPNARFVGGGFQRVGEDKLSQKGMLTLKGVDVPVELLGSIDISGETAQAAFVAMLDRATFNIGNDNPGVNQIIEIGIAINALRVQD